MRAAEPLRRTRMEILEVSMKADFDESLKKKSKYRG